MPAIVLIGGQWGDEGKGRIVDLLSEKAHIVTRYSAGNNAGHTVINERGTFRLRLVPAGICYPGKICIIGNGMAVNPKALIEEIEDLESRGVSTTHLFISDRCQVVMPYHPIIDRLDEKLRGENAVGTTGYGIGPAFADKVARIGIRMGDLIDPRVFEDRLRYVLNYKNNVLTRLYGAEALDFDQVYAEYCEYGMRLAPHVRDTSVIVHEALAGDETVLLEGAQGSLLDLDAGTYEFVSASVPSSLAAGACIGIGIGPTQIDRVYGVYKAYMTRVGNGPMPTELFDNDGERIREMGQEYGTATGRPRRCGWFDSLASRYTARVNGLTAAIFTRMDVLDTFEEIKICTSYRIDGKEILEFPASVGQLNRAQPVFESMPGWNTPTTGVRNWEDLPEAARNYVKRVEELMGVPIALVSVGPERDQFISLDSIL
ncbi:MAG: adenylosuccinate synthase [Dehalococcoidia bacterium]|nr:adenylosuccinate synthase [Dehalococcoidia bacterium]